MVEDPKLLISHLRRKLYQSTINQTMNMMMIGPTDSGKTRMLDCILGDPDTLKKSEGEFS